MWEEYKCWQTVLDFKDISKMSLTRSPISKCSCYNMTLIFLPLRAIFFPWIWADCDSMTFEIRLYKVWYIFQVYLECLLQKSTFSVCIIPRDWCGEGHVKKNLGPGLQPWRSFHLITSTNMAVACIIYLKAFTLQLNFQLMPHRLLKICEQSKLILWFKPLSFAVVYYIEYPSHITLSIKSL